MSQCISVVLEVLRVPPGHRLGQEMLLKRLRKKLLCPALEHVDVETSTHIGLELMQMNEAPSPVIKHSD